MQNYKLTICYDGTRWRGWQKQGNTDDTIQGRLERILSRMLEQPIELAGSGRTDAGVHARRQVCSFRAEGAQDANIMLTELRKFVPEDIGILSLEEAPPRFHARLSCTGKTYVYRVWNSASPHVFRRQYCLCRPGVLDLDAMAEAAQALCGQHDFSAFNANRQFKKSAVRRLFAADLEQIGPELRLCYTGDGFLTNMARILTGTLLEVGEGRRDPAGMGALLESRDRSLAGPAAPAQGLFLWDVYYDGEERTPEKLRAAYAAEPDCFF